MPNSKRLDSETCFPTSSTRLGQVPHWSRLDSTQKDVFLSARLGSEGAKLEPPRLDSTRSGNMFSCRLGSEVCLTGTDSNLKCILDIRVESSHLRTGSPRFCLDMARPDSCRVRFGIGSIRLVSEGCQNLGSMF